MLWRAYGVLGLAVWVLGAGLTVAGPGRAATAPEPRHEETRLLIDLVRSGAEEVARIGAVAACEEFSRPDSQWLQGESYLFVLDLDGNAVCHPVQPRLEGKSLLELRDPSGRTPVKSFLRELADGSDEGWVHYLWPTPEQPYAFFWKTTYIRRTTDSEGRDFLIGSGLYQMKMERFFVTEQVDEAAELIAAEGEAAFEKLRDPTGEYRFYDIYMFVLDPEGNLLVNAGFPEQEAKNVADLADRQGRLFVREMLDLAAQREAGWIDYEWPRPGDLRPSRKSSYIRRVESGGRMLIVGAGVYFE